MVKKLSKQNKLRVIKVIILVLFLIIYQGGKIYNNIPPVDMRVIITMLGIDKTDNGIRTTANVLLPVTNADNKINQIFIEAEGRNLSEAIGNFNTVSGTKVELSQCKMIVFGNEISKEGILPELKTLFGTGVVSAGIIIVSAEKIEASKFIELSNKKSDESSSSINSFISSFRNTMYVPFCTLMEFLSGNIRESQAGYMPCIELVEKKDPANAGAENNPSGGESRVFNENIDSAIIFKNGKRQGKLNNAETKGLMWVKSKAQNGTLTIEDFECDTIKYSSITGKVLTHKNDIIVDFKEGIPHVTMKVNTNIIIQDRRKIAYDLDKNVIKEPKLFGSISAAMADQIEAEVRASVDAMRRFDTDFYNLKYKFYRLKNKEIINFENDTNSDFLRDVIINYDINCNIR